MEFLLTSIVFAYVLGMFSIPFVAIFDKMCI